MQTPVTNPDPSLSFWLHISAPHPSLRPNPPALAFRLMQLLSQHPVRKPPPPRSCFGSSSPAPTPRPSPRPKPPGPCAFLLPPAWMDLSSGKVWPHVARLSRIQVISSDRGNRLLPEPAALRGRRDGETEKKKRESLSKRGS